MKFRKIGGAPAAKPASAPIKKLNESLTANESAAIKKYCELTGIQEGTVLEESAIDRWAVSEACHKHGVSQKALKNILTGKAVLMTEDVEINPDDASPAAKKAAAATDADIIQIEGTIEEEDKTAIEKALDYSLEEALRVQKYGEGLGANYPNIILEGQAGAGKTSIVKAWARKNNINLVYMNLSIATPADIGGIMAPDHEHPGYVTRQPVYSKIKRLMKPRTVIFMDEFNRSKSIIQGAVLGLVQDHIIPNEGQDDFFLPEVLFTVMAMNPAGSAYGGAGELDAAVRGRARRIKIQNEKDKVRKYLVGKYQTQAQRAKEKGDAESELIYLGRAALADAILSSRQFEFSSPAEDEAESDNENYNSTTPRTLENAISQTRGRKEQLLDVWNDNCNYKQKKTIEDILKNFVDVADKANSVFNTETTSGVIGSKSKFTKTKNNLERLEDLLNAHGHSVYGSK